MRASGCRSLETQHLYASRSIRLYPHLSIGTLCRLESRSQVGATLRPDRHCSFRPMVVQEADCFVHWVLLTFFAHIPQCNRRARPQRPRLGLLFQISCLVLFSVPVQNFLIYSMEKGNRILSEK